MTVMLVSFAHKIPLKHFLHFSTFSLAEMAVESSPQGSNANNVLLGLNPALPNKFIVEFGEGLDDIVNQDRWVEVKFLGSCPSFFPRHAKARPEAAIHVPLAQPCLGQFPRHIYACLDFTDFCFRVRGSLDGCWQLCLLFEYLYFCLLFGYKRRLARIFVEYILLANNTRSLIYARLDSSLRINRVVSWTSNDGRTQ